LQLRHPLIVNAVANDLPFTVELTEIIIYFYLQFLHCVLMLLNTIYKGTN